MNKTKLQIMKRTNVYPTANVSDKLYRPFGTLIKYLCIIVISTIVSLPAFAQKSALKFYQSFEGKSYVSYKLPEDLIFCNPYEGVEIDLTSPISGNHGKGAYFDDGSHIKKSLLRYWEDSEQTYLISMEVYDISLDELKKYTSMPNNIIFNVITQFGDYQKENSYLPYNSIKFYRADKCELINADLAGQCFIELKEPLKERYNYCVLQFSQKNDRAHVRTYYFFKDLDPEFMDNILAKYYRIATYNNDIQTDTSNK